MSMVKYRVHEVAKDFNSTSKEISQILTDYATTPKNHMQVLESEELDVIFEYLTQHNQVASIADIFNVAPKAEAKPAEKKQDKNGFFYTGFTNLQCFFGCCRSKTEYFIHLFESSCNLNSTVTITVGFYYCHNRCRLLHVTVQNFNIIFYREPESNFLFSLTYTVSTSFSLSKRPITISYSASISIFPKPASLNAFSTSL